MNRTKEKKIISINIEKVLDTLQHLLMVKLISKKGIEKYFLT
jgi:hypothetical protein